MKSKTLQNSPFCFRLHRRIFRGPGPCSLVWVRVRLSRLTGSQGNVSKNVICHAHTVSTTQNRLFLNTFLKKTVMNVYFHLGFCRCFKRHLTLISNTRIFFYLKPSCQRQKKQKHYAKKTKKTQMSFISTPQQDRQCAETGTNQRVTGILRSPCEYTVTWISCSLYRRNRTVD